jgi:hypothetical protein
MNKIESLKKAFEGIVKLSLFDSNDMDIIDTLLDELWRNAQSDILVDGDKIISDKNGIKAVIVRSLKRW